MNAAVELTGVSVHHGETLALHDATLRVDSGRVCALIGPNGAGKSTLFSAVTGAVPLTAGTVTVHGRSPAQARSAGTIAFVQQSERVDWTFPVSVRDVVEMGTIRAASLLRRRTRDDRARALEALDRVGLADLAGRQIGALSGGQRKRVFVARALAQGARVLLLDEPFAGVDTGSQDRIVSLLRDIAADDVTVIVSTHDLLGVAALADEVALIRRTVLFHGSVAAATEPGRLAAAFGLTTEDGAAA